MKTIFTLRCWEDEIGFTHEETFSSNEYDTVITQAELKKIAAERMKDLEYSYCEIDAVVYRDDEDPMFGRPSAMLTTDYDKDEE